MDPTNHQQQRSSRRSAGSSSAAANAVASPPSSMMADITSHHDDRQPSLHQGPEQKQNGPSLEQTQHPKRPQGERSRPDPPECFTVRQTLRYSREKHLSKPQQISSQSRTHHRKQRDRSNLLPLSHERKPTKAEGYQPSSHKRHQERRRSLPSREHNTTMKGNSPPRRSKPWKSKESSRTASQQRRAENLDNFDQQRLRDSHPVKSSSFQTHPRQLLQVYKDLRQKQLDLKKSQRKDVGINEENSDDNSISKGSRKFRGLAVSSFSCESSSMDGCSENHSQTSRGKNDESDDDGEESSIDGSDSNSLTVLHDEGDYDDFEYGTSQDGNNTNTAKITSPNNHPPEEVYLKVGTYHRQVSIEGVSTLVTATSTTSEATTAVEDIKKQRQLKQQARDNDVTCTNYRASDAAAAPTKTREESSPQGSIGNLTTSRSSGATIPILARSIKYHPTFPSYIDNQLLQKQINYLQYEHELAATSPGTNNQSHDDDSASTPPSPSQLIVYVHHQRPTTREADIKVILQRREMIHNRNRTKRYGCSLDNHTGRRWSFS